VITKLPDLPEECHHTVARNAEVVHQIKVIVSAKNWSRQPYPLKINPLLQWKLVNCERRRLMLTITFFYFFYSQRKVATVCMWGGHIYNLLLSNFLRIPNTKNYLNRLVFNWVIEKNKTWTFLCHIVVHIHGRTRAKQLSSWRAFFRDNIATNYCRYSLQTANDKSHFIEMKRQRTSARDVVNSTSLPTQSDNWTGKLITPVSTNNRRCYSNNSRRMYRTASNIALSLNQVYLFFSKISKNSSRPTWWRRPKTSFMKI